MEFQVSLDRFGRIVLPKRLRDELAVSAGDPVVVSLEGNAIRVTPKPPEQKLKRVQGIWMLDSDDPVSADATGKVTDAVRRERGAIKKRGTR